MKAQLARHKTLRYAMNLYKTAHNERYFILPREAMGDSNDRG